MTTNPSDMDINPEATATTVPCDGEHPVPACMSLMCWQLSERDRWLNWRRGGIGSSDVAPILGVPGAFGSPWSVWLSKVERVDEPDSAVTKRGRLLERAVGEWAASELGCTLFDPEPLVHRDHDWARCTPDFWVSPTGIAHAPLSGLETKTARVLDGWGEPGSGDIPLTYRCQVVWMMAVANVDQWHVAVFATIPERWELYLVERDMEIEGALLERCGAWWTKHVVNREPPPLDTSAAASRWLSKAYAKPLPRMRHMDASLNDMARVYRYAQGWEKEAKAMVAACNVRLKAEIGENQGLEGDEVRIKWSRFDKSSTDLKQLRKDHPEIVPLLDEYTTKTPTGRLHCTWKDQ